MLGMLMVSEWRDLVFVFCVVDFDESGILFGIYVVGLLID